MTSAVRRRWCYPCEVGSVETNCFCCGRPMGYFYGLVNSGLDGRRTHQHYETSVSP